MQQDMNAMLKELFLVVKFNFYPFTCTQLQLQVFNQGWHQSCIMGQWNDATDAVFGFLDQYFVYETIDSNLIHELSIYVRYVKW